MTAGGLSPFLVRVDRRLRLARAVGFASWALLAPAATLLVLEALGLGRAAIVGAVAAAAFAILGALLAAGRRDLPRAASAADREAGLLDLLKTGLEIGERSPDSPWRPLIERRAGEAIAGLEPAIVAPVRPRPLPLALGGLALGGALALALWPVGPGAGTDRASLDAAAAKSLADTVPGAHIDGEEHAVPGDREQVPAVAARALPQPGARVDRAVAEAELEAAAGERDRGESSADGETSLDGETSREPGAAAAAATLRDERRTQGRSEPPRPGSERGSGERSDVASNSDSEGEAATGAEASDDPGREVGEQAVASDTPSAAAAARRRGAPEAGAAQTAAAGQEGASPGGEREDAAESGAAGAGLGTTAQDSETTPLGQATELEVTLEEVLLATRSGVEPTERRSRPSRRADVAGAGVPPSRPGRAAAAAVELERPALHVPYPARSRQLVREYFTPVPAPSTDAPAHQETTG